MANNVAYHLYGLDSVDYQKETIEKYVPTLYIGLGGTGKQILLRFRKNLFEQYVNWREEFARFLAIDTDDQPTEAMFEQVGFRRERGEFLGCSISHRDYRQAIEDTRKRFDRRFTDWLHPDFESLVPPTALESGAGTYRQAGRLAFFLNYAKIKDQILQHFRSALHFAAQRPQMLFGEPGEVFSDRLEVVIVTSLAGGTGSGMFMDTAYLVRHLLDTIPDFGRITTHTTLIALLPDAFAKASPNLGQRFRQNSYAAMLEMEQFNTPRPADPFGRLQGTATSYLDRPAFRVNWSDPVGDGVAITGRPWDTCYLVDDTHDSQRLLKTSREDVYQLIADYLFLDLGNNPFAVAKRSARSNHTQLTDRTLAVQVLRQAPVSSTSRRSGKAPPPPSVVYENYYGCTYSSFGLSEIQIDRDRVVRAAGYQLAARLIRERWLSTRNALPDPEVTRLIQEDLLGGTIPYGESVAINFSREGLFSQLTANTEKNLRTSVRDEFRTLGQTRSVQKMRLAIDATMKKLQLAVASGRESGGDYQLMAAVANKLQGVLPDIGPLCQRLKVLVRAQCESHGIFVAQRIIEGLFAAFDKAAKQARTDAGKSGGTEDQILRRIDDAVTVPWPCNKMAMTIEFQRLLPQAENLAWNRYSSQAWGMLERLYAGLRDFVGCNKVLDFATGPTLWRRCQTQGEFLNQVSNLLKERFDEAATVTGSDRKQSLIPAPGKDGENYDKMIRQALIDNKSVGANQESRSGADVSFDWQRAEQAVLDQIPTLDGRTGGWTRMDLIETYERDFRSNVDRLPAIVETLARACANILHSHLKMEDLAGGNVVNHLKSCDPLTRQERLSDFVASSGPRLPMVGAATRSLESFRPAWRTILGCTAGSNDVGPTNAAEIEKQVTAGVESEKTGDPAQNKVHEIRSMLESKLVLVREMAGVPLHVYDRLDELGKAYFDPSLSQQQLTAHLRYSEGFEELPDIEELGGDAYERIQRNVVAVIRGILLEFIMYQEDSQRFIVELTDSRRSAVTRVNLGSRLSRVLQHAATRIEVVDFLAQQWTEWYDKVAKREPTFLALLYNGSQQTLSEFPQEVDFRSARNNLPLQSCLEDLLMEIEQLLTSTTEGEALFNQLRRRTEMDPDYREWKVWYPKLCKQLTEKKSASISPPLRCIGEHLPFFTLNWRELVTKGRLDSTEVGFNYPSPQISSNE